MRLREARIILTSDHSPEELERRLLQAFGGFTKMSRAFGVWQSPSGEVYEEHVIVYDVAAEPTHENELKLRRLADWARVEYDQEAIYLRWPEGDVELIDGTSVEAAA